jgi:hypothetical protein
MDIWHLLFILVVLPNLLFIFIVWREEKELDKANTNHYLDKANTNHYLYEDEDDVVE